VKRIVHTAAALLIGNELLSGKVADENLFPLATTLRGLGIALRRVVVVADDPAEIAAELNLLRHSHDVVLTSGGVGPTHDDVTLVAVAQAFEVPAVRHPMLSEMLRAHYKASLNDAHLRMALVPEGAALLSAEGIVWPTVVMGNVWVFPGVPKLFRMKLLVLREHLQGPAPFFSRAVFCQLDEGQLTESLDAVVKDFPSVEIGSYPRLFDSDYKTKITFDARSESDVEQALTAFCALLPGGEPIRVA
jgi:molybdenum cofactor synthesis domain-containing protein